VDLRRHAAAKRNAKTMRRIVRSLRLRQKHRRHRAEQIADRRIVPLRGGPKAGGGEFRLQHVSASVQERLIERIQRIGVEQGQRREQHIALADSERTRRIDAPPEQLRLRTTHTLCRPGGARCVEDRNGVAGTHGPRRGRGSQCRQRYRERPDIDGPGISSDDPDPRRQLDSRLDTLDRASELSLDDEERRTRVPEDVGELEPA
jgi:hypothetical protein